MTSPVLTVLDREPSGLISTFFNEIVTCRLADGRVRRLLLKRGVPDPDPTYGHRGGPSYEAEVYRTVLEPLRTSAPRLHAVNTDPVTGETSLLIDYIAEATTLKHSGLEHLLYAARWIGTFHRLNEPRVSELRDTITEYNAHYYLGWMNRTLELTRNLQLSWLPGVCRSFEAGIDEFLLSPSTIIHGEYYPMNILVSGEMIAPVDWESAAIAAGEIDLSSLAEGWDETETNALAAEYSHARWPDGAPSGFERRLVIAEMYMMFRWLGDRPEWTTGEEADWQFSNLQRLGARLEVLP